MPGTPYAECVHPSVTRVAGRADGRNYRCDLCGEMLDPEASEEQDAEEALADAEEQERAFDSREPPRDE